MDTIRLIASRKSEVDAWLSKKGNDVHNVVEYWPSVLADIENNMQGAHNREWRQKYQADPIPTYTDLIGDFGVLPQDWTFNQITYAIWSLACHYERRPLAHYLKVIEIKGI